MKKGVKKQSANERIADGVRERAIDLARYETGLIRRVNRKLAELERKIMASLAAADMPTLEYVVALASREIKTAYANILALMSDDLGSLVEVEAESLGASIAEEMGAEIVRTVISGAKSYLLKSENVRGVTPEEWWSSQSDQLRRRVTAAIRIAVADGQTKKDIVASVKIAAPFAAASRDAKALVRTSVQSTVNQTRVALYKENQDLIGSLQHVSTLDDRTSLVCIARDGLRWTLDGKPIGHKMKFAVPPLHWNCRSTLVPVTKSWEELGAKGKEIPAGERASVDGVAPADIRYEDWLRSKDEAFQNRVLGRTRAELWRSGRLKVSQMIDQTGRELRIDELRPRKR